MYADVEKKLTSLIRQSIEAAFGLPAGSACGQAAPPSSEPLPDPIPLDIPKEKAFGDLSCSVAMKLAGRVHKAPRQVAEVILGEFTQRHGRLPESEQFVERVEIKGAGFLNFFLRPVVFEEMLDSICRLGPRFGCSDAAGGRKVLLEFVSANPTGPLSVAHARQAAVGDALANILAARGHAVTREYYLNDEGNQVNLLGRSIDARYRELSGEKVDLPEEGYQGAYIRDLAAGLLNDKKARARIAKLDEKKREDFFRDHGIKEILGIIQGELERFGVRFDVWYSQRKKLTPEVVSRALADVEGHIFEAEGALWLRSTSFGDDKDRVLRKSDGDNTYFAPDIAYHKDKFARGFKELINIWGPDHHGYVARLKAAVQALGHPAQDLRIIIVQLATLYRDGVPVPMSTRKGQYVTLTELLAEVGRDAARFFFLMRKTDSHLDFDLALAKRQTPENPVYYVQYAHARICGILASGGLPSAAGAEGKNKTQVLHRLVEPEERALMKALFAYGTCLEVCVSQSDPYSLTAYLQSLAAAFHRFYDRHKVLADDAGLARARLVLVRAVKTVLANGLDLLGVSAPEKM